MAFTFKQLRYFVAVAETGKVTDAAIAVSISASTITEGIKDLEYYLAVKLFDRTRTGLELTPEGYRFLTHSKRILADIDNAKHSIQDNQEGIQGKIVIGTTVTVSGYFLSRLLQRFSQAFPQVDVHIEEHTRKDIEKKIDQRDLDLGIILVSNVRQSKNRTLVPLIRSQRRLWLPVNHPLLQKDIVTLEDISKENYIQLTIDEAEHTTSSYWKKYKLKPKVVFKTTSVEAVRSLVATGKGVTILSDMVHRPWSVDGDRINTVEIKEKIPSMDTGLLWRSNTAPTDLVKTFIDFTRLLYTSGGQP